MTLPTVFSQSATPITLSKAFLVRARIILPDLRTDLINRKWARCFLALTEEQRRQAPARKQPSGLPIFGAAAALLVGRRSIKDILTPRALQHRQISGNAPVPHFDTGS